MKRAEARKAEAEATLAATREKLYAGVPNAMSPAQYYSEIAGTDAFSGSTEPGYFCIKLLEGPIDVQSEPAYTLFASVGGLSARALETGEGGVQDMWLRALGEDASRWPKEVGGRTVTLTIKDTHASPFRNGRKPDNSHFAVGYPCGHTELGVVAIGDLKRRVTSDFTPSDKGELIGRVKDFLAVQPGTIGMTAYLTDGHWVQFFRVNRDEGSTQGFQYIEGPRHELGSPIGFLWFWGLMTTRVSGLGWNVPRLSIKGSPLTVERFLGKGSRRTVYHCTYRAGAGATAGAGARCQLTEDVVVKMCSTAEEAKAERQVLQRLNDAGVPGVQRLVGMTECGKGIVTTPLAAPLVDTEGLREVLNGVVTTLERMHALGLVHRDVSKANILVTPEGNSLLVDMGGAVPPDEPVPYHGTIAYAAPHILEHLLAAAEQETMPGEIVPRTSDDLQSLVRVVFLLVFPHLKRGAPLRSRESEFLKHRIDAFTMGGRWSDADTMAKERLYDSLRALFDDMFPATNKKKRKASAI